VNVRQGQKDGAVRQIRPRDDVFDAVQNGRPGSLKQNLVLVGLELADRKAAAARKAAQGIGDPMWKIGQIVESQEMAIAGGDEQIAFFPRYRPDRRRVGVDQRPEDF
jgi:hypothetical protein